ncbi:MAG TPA: glycosyltransferase family 2 protein [Chloroflexota bacterium]|nr:glycosyltransferase family 2 protein [Chloroflexota bacterium]
MPDARRVLEVLPTATVWLIITAPVWGALFVPAAFGFGLILFSVYWLWKSLGFASGVLIGFWRMHHAQQRDWVAASQHLAGYADLRHLVIVPTYGESDEIVADTLHCLTLQDVPLDRVSVVLAFEERDPVAHSRAERLSARFAPLFQHFLITFHPDAEGEVRGKSANLTWAAKQVQVKLIESGKLDPEHLIVTVCDADSRLHRRYLAALSHDVLSHEHGFLHIFQPAILFYANHWRLIAPLRALNSIYSLWELARMVPTHRLVTQSTYSLSWRAVREVGYWDTDVIPEDSHMCFKVLFHYGQRVKVRPIFLPVYADAAEGPTLRRTMENQYQQILRWAWGVSDIPYVTLGAARARDLRWYTRILRVVWYVEEHLMWPSHWFLLTLGGLVPRLVNPAFAHSPLGMWQTNIVSTIMGLCLPCLLLVIVVDWRLRPEHPDGEDPIDVLIGWASFALLPVFGLLLCALPALDAHTRLLFGRRLEYRVTEKVPVQARFRDQQGNSAPAPTAKAAREAGSLQRARFDELPQYRAYAPGSTTAVTDAVLLVYRDLR